MACIDKENLLKDLITIYAPMQEQKDILVKCIKKVNEQPTADVEEVKHGEWLPVQYTYFGLKRYECSECKDDEYWQKRYLEHKEKYCPNCGAKMDGGRDTQWLNGLKI